MNDAEYEYYTELRWDSETAAERFKQSCEDN